MSLNQELEQTEITFQLGGNLPPLSDKIKAALFDLQSLLQHYQEPTKKTMVLLAESIGKHRLICKVDGNAVKIYANDSRKSFLAEITANYGDWITPLDKSK